MKPWKPSLADRVVTFISPEKGIRRMAASQAVHQFSFDGAKITHERNSAPQNINPNDYQKQRDRLQLMREQEDLENNFAPAKTLNKKYAMYVAPISYHAQTGDEALDNDIELYWNEECVPNCDVTNRFPFYQMALLGVMGRNRGGDYGWAFMRPGIEDDMPEEEIVKLPLKIQAVEADRLGGLYQNVVQDNYIAGVIIDQYGAPEAYRVFRRSPTVGQYTDPVDVPASQFVHYIDPLRLDMYRSMPMLDTGTTSARDLYEMINFLKGKAKLSSALTVFTSSLGSIQGGGAMDPYMTSSFQNNQSGLQQDIKYGQMMSLPNGTDIKFPDTAAPGAESQYLMLLCLKLLAWSYNLPYSFALDATELGGVSTRLESEQARAEFERGQGILAPHLHRIKNAYLVDAIAKGFFSPSVADKICRGRWGYRPHPTPDIGKEAQANVTYWQNGLLNPIKFFSDDGQTAQKAARDMAKWAKIKKDSADAVGMTVQDVFGNGPIAPGTNPNEQQQKKEDASNPSLPDAPKPTPEKMEMSEYDLDKLNPDDRAYIDHQISRLTGKGISHDQAVALAYKYLKQYGNKDRLSRDGKTIKLEKKGK